MTTRTARKAAEVNSRSSKDGDSTSPSSSASKQGTNVVVETRPQSASVDSVPQTNKRKRSASGTRPSSQAVVERPAKRIAGRRRAPHANLRIEAALRRQLKLKTSYRQVIKALKPVLDELGKRAVQGIEDDALAHVNATEHEDVEAALLNAFVKKQDQLFAAHELELQHLNDTTINEQNVLLRRHKQTVEDRREEYIQGLKLKLMKIVRASNQEDDSDATQDEDNVIPRPLQVNERGRPIGPLNPEYDSRSRLHVQIDRAWRESQGAHKFRDSQRQLDRNSLQNKPEGFATFDPSQRIESNAHRNIQTLGRAADAIENLTPVNPEGDPRGLQVLAEVAGAHPGSFTVTPSAVISAIPSSSLAIIDRPPAQTEVPRKSKQMAVASKKAPTKQVPANPTQVATVDLAGKDKVFEPTTAHERTVEATASNSTEHAPFSAHTSAVSSAALTELPVLAAKPTPFSESETQTASTRRYEQASSSIATTPTTKVEPQVMPSHEVGSGQQLLDRGDVAEDHEQVKQNVPSARDRSQASDVYISTIATPNTFWAEVAKSHRIGTLPEPLYQDKTKVASKTTAAAEMSRITP
ncbi:hypothetical protein LTR66_003373, partial [Elasticomyces elasticus]